eukprot:9312191-Pyramimonas_sp.AAC.2
MSALTSIPIKKLNLTKVCIHASIALLSDFKTLRSLHLEQCSLKDAGFMALARLTSLTSLYLEGVDHCETNYGWGKLHTLESLTTISIIDSYMLAEGLRALHSLPSLTTIDLTRSYLVGDPWSPAFARPVQHELDKLTPDERKVKTALPALRTLSVFNVSGPIGDDWLKSLVCKVPTLTSLNIQNTLVTAEGLKTLATLPALASLTCNLMKVEQEYCSDHTADNGKVLATFPALRKLNGHLPRYDHLHLPRCDATPR